VNIQEYISSGVLEAYILGTLTEQECAELEANAVKYPEVKAELDAIENAMNAYAKLHSMQPSDSIKEKIMEQIDGGAENESKIRKMRMDEEERRDPRNKMTWSIAASVLLMISLTINIYLSSRTINAEGYVHELLKTGLKKDSTINIVRAKYNQSQADLAVLKDPMYKMVTLKGQADTSAKAMVCWCPDDKTVYFEADKMPELPKGMQYQLWAMVDGKPVNEGVITMTTGLHKMNSVAGATEFAVTMEKEGGSDTPHGNMIVLGNI
jgi:anti-sigma-K factor RskA